MSNNLDQFIGFIGNALKFALLTFTGVFIIIGICWILYRIFEEIYIAVGYVSSQIRQDEIPQEERKLIPRKIYKENDLDKAEISVVQYGERKKYQKIRCPYCNALSKVIRERYHGVQTRECRNGHIFVYDYESEMLIQDELNAKYK